MKNLRTLRLAAAALCSWPGATFAGETPLDAWEALARRTDLDCALKSNGHDEITAQIANRSSAAITVEIPAGLVCELADRSGKVIALRAAPMTIAGGGSFVATIPATAQTCTATRARVPKLDPLLAWLAQQPDAPRATTQLAVLSLLEDIGFSQWQGFLLAALPNADPATHPTPGEIVQAVDALAILREIAPGTALALAKDPELKLRALRNPWTRAKAAQLYGIALPAPDGSAVEIPTIGQLLHRIPGDNCPVCRARARMQPPADGF